MPKLRITIGDQTSEKELTGPLKAGRLPDLGLPLAVKGVSREHFMLGKTKEGEWAIKDLGSSNGTFVNGTRVGVAKLKHKDVIQVSTDCEIVFWDPAPIVERKKKPSGPIVLKSRADKLKEQRDEELRKKRERLREKHKAKEKEILQEKEEAASDAGTIDIDSEAMLDKLIREKEKFDDALESGEQHFVFGNYRLLKRLAAGGMGFVFKAQHRATGMRVALKILRTEIIDEQNIARFKQEAWAISAFDHKNIVKVTDLAKHAGMYHIAMEYVDGPDFLKVGFQQTLTFWQIADAIYKVADILALVHKRSIWHRDIKPQNILLDKRGEPRLIDFGIATVEREQDDATKTADGLIMGTPAFLSPEQASRGTMEIDGRADLYSLGAVMYYLLTGRRPFTGKSALAILKKNMTDAPPDPLSIDPHIPPGLVQICLKLMEKKPRDRYQSCEELQAAINQWRKTKGGREEGERHRKIMKLRERKKKLIEQREKQQKN